MLAVMHLQQYPSLSPEAELNLVLVLVSSSLPGAATVATMAAAGVSAGVPPNPTYVSNSLI
jgi:hypothetical protein